MLRFISIRHVRIVRRPLAISLLALTRLMIRLEGWIAEMQEDGCLSHMKRTLRNGSSRSGLGLSAVGIVPACFRSHVCVFFQSFVFPAFFAYSANTPYGIILVT